MFNFSVFPTSLNKKPTNTVLCSHTLYRRLGFMYLERKNIIKSVICETGGPLRKLCSFTSGPARFFFCSELYHSLIVSDYLSKNI
jgi:hypothetical protein